MKTKLDLQQFINSKLCLLLSKSIKPPAIIYIVLSLQTSRERQIGFRHGGTMGQAETARINARINSTGQLIEEIDNVIMGDLRFE